MRWLDCRLCLTQATGMPVPGMPAAPGGQQQQPFGYSMGGGPPPGPQGMVLPPQQQPGGPPGMGQGTLPPGLSSGAPTGVKPGPPMATPPASTGRAGGNSMVPPGPPPVFSTPPLPGNMRLMYTDDAVSVEEKRAAEMRRY
ncbi:zinc finger (c2h2 type) domain-containing protein [Cyclospora cayetanensis]|uniref:Zinc finger (C2h2 type) domain-containing protein n=1 Tax=Cyclospora cayetanensis TaxID=88456 RepID=A0A1D3D2E9_9EIME|nr:zinc finger (c2h2 type) domain-containing protein [Cyclospora cayetanensis]